MRTDPKAQPRHAGISMLLIDLKSPGITVKPIQTIKGDAEFAEELFVNVRVPRENLLGALNAGWSVANNLLGSERFTTGHPRNAAVYLNRADKWPSSPARSASRYFCTGWRHSRSICSPSRPITATPPRCTRTGARRSRWRR